MDVDKYTESFQIIAEAGDARSLALEAIDKANEYDFEQAEELLKKATLSMNKAHQIQTDMIVREVNGQPVDTHIIMVHSQDHFAMATESIDMAKIIIRLYKKIQELEKGEKDA